MTAAFIMGVLGLILTFTVGISVLHLSWLDLLWCVFLSNGAALCSLILTLYTERTSWMVRYWPKSSFKSWSILAFLYFGSVWAFSPPLIDFHSFLILTFPLCLSVGFCLYLFGPIQDTIVRRHQRRQTGQS